MKYKILFILLLSFSMSKAQVPNYTSTKFVNGLFVPNPSSAPNNGAGGQWYDPSLNLMRFYSSSSNSWQFYLSPAQILGTTSQVNIANNGSGGLTFSLPQNIATTSAVTFGSVLSSGNNINVNSGNGDLGFLRNSTLRWLIRMDSDVEGGANTGSTFRILRRADDGSLLGAAMSIDRATGTVNFPGRVTVTSTPSSSLDVIRKTEYDALVARTINTSLPLSGGGDLSSSRTLSIAGLSGFGLAGQSIRVNSSTNGFEYYTPSTGSGSVTSFGKVDGFGISSSVSNPTTTPVHTISVDTTLIASRANSPTFAQLQTKINNSSASFIKQSGNAFGATMTVGTTDVNDLNLIRNGVVNLQITVNGANFPLGAKAAINSGGSNDLVRNVDLQASTLQPVSVSGTSQTMSPNKVYIPHNSSLTTFTLPSTATEGQLFQIVGEGSGGWRISQNSGQQIVGVNVSTTSGTTGYVQSTNANCTITIRCTLADTKFTITSSQGTLTIN